jgi:thiol-disulfide isomerase/thioredoxin
MLVISNSILSQVTIKGIVKHAKDSIIVFKEADMFTNITRTIRDKRYKANIDKNNRFTITLPEQSINRWMIKTENGYQFFDLLKGADIELTADFSKPSPLTAIGSYAADFNYLTYALLKEKKMQRQFGMHPGIKGKNIDSILLFRKQMAANKKSVLDKYKQTHNMSDAYYKWTQSRYTYEPYERTFVENIDKKDTISNTVLLHLLELGINDNYAALNTIAYNDLVDLYMQEKARSAKIDPTLQAYFTFATGNYLQGNTREVFLTRFISRLKQVDDSIYNPVYKLYDEAVKDTIIKSYVIEERKEYQTLQASGTADVSKYTTLNEIFSKYRGKVMYVDFWASWCAPCRSEMPNATELKQQLKNKDVVFVYLGYRDKEKVWLKAREDLAIEGEHYLLSDTLMKEADEAFDITGIPHYAIIDKRGNVVNKHAGRPREVYEQLLKLAEKSSR